MTGPTHESPKSGRARSAQRALLACLCPSLGLCLALAFTACGARPEAQRNVLLITVDTLRADYLHAYGFEHARTPHIDSLAARGALFETAIAAATLTAPAHASIMTARFAREHSIGTLNGETTLEGYATLAEHFREAGYDTAAFVSNVILRRRSGLDLGFDVYDDEMDAGEINRRAFVERPAEDTVTRALGWIAGRGPRPFFAWIHLQDPHGPYTPPEPWRGRVGAVPLRMKRPLPVLDSFSGRAGIPSYQALEGVRDPAVYAGRYAEEILYADHWIGELVAGAEAQGAARGVVVLLTADHGESLGEGGWFFQHGQSTTPDLARVPFIVVAPDLAPQRRDERVSHVDVAPTLAELAGIGVFDGSGLSLAPLLRGGARLPSRFLYSDTEGEAGVYFDGGYLRAAGSAAALRPKAAQPLHFEALRPNAQAEWRPADMAPDAQAQLERYIAARVPAVAADVMAPEHVEQLRALGYLDGADARGAEPEVQPAAPGAAE